MLTLKETVAYFQQHHPEELELAGPTVIEHVLSGGEYGSTENAQYVDPWEALSNTITIITLLQFAYQIAGAAVSKTRNIYETRKEKAEKLREDKAALNDIRMQIIEDVERKHGIKLDPRDPLLSDESIKRALLSIPEKEPIE
jgi:hypothetical protein